MNGLIPLGIPLSEFSQLLTTGLSMGDPIPPAPVVPSGGTLPIGVPTAIVSGEDAPFESLAYTIPSAGTRITWQVIGTGPDVLLEGSLNFANFALLDTTAAEGVREIVSGATSLRAVVNAGTGVTVIVTIKREKF